ncbi:MAG: M48 family metalloprotease [Desulfobacteraceae bacterium]|nr:M48 family metalloprotease [Pseudomonadota bacterium]MBU4463437.1 M48 family metalloprotease [Pseudomonadota bacterium]MCG2755464.1 M48 family metalloprotease [Desulfobacteraceae bacterium]
MFSNFIYLIIVLLIYTTYQPSEETNFAPLETSALFFSLIIAFIFFVRLQFRKLEKQISEQSPYHLDYKFNSTLSRLSITAIVLFAINIYGLSLPSFLINVSVFTTIPTLQALLFIGLFVFYIAIVWGFAYRVYQKLNMDGMSGREYIFSNISFSIPVLIPWFLLSGIADIINALPFELPKYLLSTTEGEIIYFMVFLLGVSIIGPEMIRKFWRCKPLEPGFHRSRIENLCQKAGVEYAEILSWPISGGRMITAGVMGLIKKFRYILVTNTLLRFLEPEEIDAVIAHEIGHIKRKHLWFYLLFFVGYLVFSYAGFDLIIYLIIYADLLFSIINIAGFDRTAVYSTVLSLVTIIIFLVYFRFIFGFFMRNFERQADIHVYTLCKSSKPLISSLEKIALTSGQASDKPNWHHFSIKERIEYLKRCETDKRWIIFHNQKIRKSIAAYLAVMILIGGIGYKLNFGETKDRLNKYFFEKIILRELEKTPDNHELHKALGDLFYSRKNYAKTIEAYERSLTCLPDNPQVLNNLAWLFATCDDEKFRDPKRAVMLARKAVQLKEAPHILDTLAESFYVNNQIQDAIATERRALDLAKKNRSYYEKQLEKFVKANVRIKD